MSYKKNESSKIKIKKGDTVIVLSGKDKGKKGKVLEAWPNEGKVVVERVNIVKRHQRRTQQFQGGIIEKAKAIHVAKVMLVCPKCNEPARVTRSEVDGKKVRTCKSCNEVVDKVK